ncbi:hypothetical protein ACFQO7_22090 [Catellatospora aurea]|uniref:Uncharacterized protein n=1 Tax=Catellatospora aurea TaxID=1337874 RepID=A0ABW2GYS8_9ACTN
MPCEVESLSAPVAAQRSRITDGAMAIASILLGDGIVLAEGVALGVAA